MSIFEHVLDYSFYTGICTISRQFHQVIFNALGNRLERGESRDIIIRYDGRDFNARLDNVDIKGRAAEVIRFRWIGRGGLSTYLQQKFADDFAQITVLHNNKVKELPANLTHTAYFSSMKPNVLEMAII